MEGYIIITIKVGISTSTISSVQNSNAFLRHIDSFSTYCKQQSARPKSDVPSKQSLLIQ